MKMCLILRKENSVTAGEQRNKAVQTRCVESEVALLVGKKKVAQRACAFKGCAHYRETAVDVRCGLSSTKRMLELDPSSGAVHEWSASPLSVGTDTTRLGDGRDIVKHAQADSYICKESM